MIDVLITLLVIIPVLVFGVIWYALSLLPPPFGTIAQLILLVILLPVLLGYLLLPLIHVRPLP